MTDASPPSLSDLSRRLIALAETPPFRFRDTPRAQARAYLQNRARIAGYDRDEIAAAEAALGLNLPQALAEFYRLMGRARAGLFAGSDLAPIEALADLTAELPHFVQAGGPPIPKTYICFMTHQGYVAYAMPGTPPGAPRAPDAPVFALIEGEAAPRQAAASLAAYLDAEVRLMEEVHEMQRANGGYYLTLAEGRVRETHPALNDRPRPLDTEDAFLD